MLQKILERGFGHVPFTNDSGLLARAGPQQHAGEDVSHSHATSPSHHLSHTETSQPQCPRCCLVMKEECSSLLFSRWPVLQATKLWRQPCSLSSGGWEGVTLALLQVAAVSEQSQALYSVQYDP